MQLSRTTSTRQAQEGMEQRLLPAPNTANAAREAKSEPADFICESSSSEMSEKSTAPSPGLSAAPLGCIAERGEAERAADSADGLSCTLDEVPYAPDADADVCAACALTYATLAAGAGALACAVAFAAGACCARVGMRVRAACRCGAVGPYVP